MSSFIFTLYSENKNKKKDKQNIGLQAWYKLNMELYVQTTIDMPPNEATALCLDDNFDENENLKEFYESHLPSLYCCSWNLISYTILNDIAVKINETKSSDEDWRLYAEEMGLDNKTMAQIKASAYCHRELEILHAMHITARQRLKFGHIIKALIKTARFDVLKEIEPFVKNLLVKISQGQIDNSPSSVACKNENDAAEPDISKKSPTHFCEQKCEINSLQKRSISSRFKSALKISDSPKIPEESLEEIKVPSAPREEKITVLIQHAESESSIAEELSSQFASKGIIATTLNEVNDLTLIEPVNILDTVFREVDFIVPVLSEKFMEEIYPTDHEEYLENVNIQNNKKLHDLILAEYSYNRCVNYRVRPVIVEGFSRRPADRMAQSLLKQPIFTFAFRLPNEVSKLINVLKKTKELRLQQLVQ